MTVASAAAVDNNGNVYVEGRTASPVFPATKMFNAPLAPSSASPFGSATYFAMKLTPDGRTIQYATLWGSRAGLDGAEATAAMVDSRGYLYVAGNTSSLEFPVSNPAQRKLAGGVDAFVTKLSPDGESLAYSTYLGGAGNDSVAGLAVNAKGEAHLAGTTYSQDFPRLNSLAPAERTGHYRAFAAKLSADGGRLQYSTLFPGSDNNSAAGGIDLDASGDAWVAGYTQLAEFPTTKNAFQATLKGGTDLFLVQLGDDPAAPASSLAATPGLLPFTAPVGGAAPAAQTIAVTAAAAGSTQTFTVSTTASWLSATPASTTVPATVTVSVNAAGMTIGSYQGSVVLTPASGEPLTIPVTLTVRPEGAVIAGVSPSTIPYSTTQATPITITGSGFGQGALVMFSLWGGKVQAMDVTRVDSRTIRTSIPAWMPSVGTQIGVSVTNPGGCESNVFNITVLK